MDGGDALCGRKLGAFVIMDRLGQGGFGAVYRAEQPRLGREAVVKVMLAHHQRDGMMIQRFLREARLASRFDHPFAAHIYEFGAEEDGLLWIAMERVHGVTLSQWIAERGPIPLGELCPLFDRIAEVVHSAHERGIVHRDLKPANVMVISRAGRLIPKLLDFGIAKSHAAPALAGEPVSPRDLGDWAGSTLSTAAHLRLPGGDAKRAEASPPPPAAGAVSSVDDTVDRGALTREGSVVGSPAYMAPEQWTNAAAADARSDLYALAAVAFEAATGRRLFEARTAADLFHHHTTSAVPPLGEGFPPDLDRVMARALAKKPEDRYPTALELAAAFRSAAGVDVGVPGAVLPKLDADLRTRWTGSAPQPLAEAVAALEAARNAHQLRDAVSDAARTASRWVMALTLACRSRLPGDPEDSVEVDGLRELRQRDLAEEEWLALARSLVRPFRGRPRAHPMPELVTFLEREAARVPRDLARGSDSDVRDHLARALPALERLLGELAFVFAYPLAVPREDGLELWMGIRRSRRVARDPIEGLVEGQPILLDADGRPHLKLWPLAQVAAPSPGAPEELFLFDGRHRAGARLAALPGTFERSDDRLWDWLGDAWLPDAGGEPADAVPPYPGLAAFTSADAERFFGREREIEAFVNRLRGSPLLVVVGPSGSGKSSFVQAGVIPALPAGWRSVTVRPGPAPFDALEARLGPGPRSDPAALGDRLRDEAAGGTLVLVVDQLEELFTLCRDATERSRYAAAVTAAARAADDPVRVVVTLRDDFLMRADQLAFRDRLAQGLVLMSTPAPAELERILVEPLRRAGYGFDDAELTARMVAEVKDAPAGLALLSFTASRLWELRDRHFRRIPRSAYEALGGVGGALARHAEETLASLTSEEQRLVREAFRHLVTAEGTRAVLTRAELGQLLGKGADGVVEKLIAARLLDVAETAGGDDRVEIVHEALLDAWPRLVEWRRDDEQGARLRDQLRTAARQWEVRGRSRGLLWRDDALAEYRQWRARQPGPVTATEEAFALASLGDEGRRRRARRVAIGGALVILSAAVLLLFTANQSATRERARAMAGLRDEYFDQGRRALLEGRTIHAVLYLAEATRLGAAGPALELLTARARRRLGTQLRSFAGHRAQLLAADFSPDQARVLTAAEDGSAALWDTATGRRLATLPIAGEVVWMASFDRAGGRVLTAGGNRFTPLADLRLWDAATGKLAATLEVPAGPVRAAAFVDGGGVVCAGRDGAVRWFTGDGRLAATLGTHGAAVNALAVSADGRRAVTGSDDRTARVWDLQAGTLVHTLEDEGAVRLVAISPDGATIATVGTRARLWRTSSGQPVATLAGHEDRIDAVAFAPAGDLVVSAGRDSTARIYTLEGRQVAVLRGHAGFVFDATFDASGGRVATASADGNARVWDTRSGALLGVLSGHLSGVKTVRFSADGTRLLTASLDGTARLFRVEPTEVRAILEAGTPVTDVAFSGDGRRLVTSNAGGSATVWRVPDGARVATLSGRAGMVQTSRFSPDMRIVVTAADDGAVLWDAETGDVVRALAGPSAPVMHAVVRPGSEEVATASSDGKVRLYRVADGVQVAALDHGDPLMWIEYSPDGRLLVSAGGRQAVLWSVEDRREIARLAGHTAPIWAATFSPDGARIVTASNDRTAMVWSAGGQRLATLAGHAGAVFTARFGASGDRLVTASEDGTAKLWDARTYALLGTFEGHRERVSHAELSPDGAFVATAGADRSVILWDAVTRRPLVSFENTSPVLYAVFSPDGRFLASASRGASMLWELDRVPRPAEILKEIERCLPLRVSAGAILPATIASDGCL